MTFDDGQRFELPFEYLRVYSPSAEVRGHGPGQETLQIGKHEVGITRRRAGRQLRRAPRVRRRPRHRHLLVGLPVRPRRDREDELWQQLPGSGCSELARSATRRCCGSIGRLRTERHPPLTPCATDPLRLPAGRRRREGRARARRVRFGRRQVRPDERPDVGWACIALWKRSRCRRPATAPGRARARRGRRHRRPRAPASRRRSAPAGWSSSPTSTPRCCGGPRPRCSIAASCGNVRYALANAERLPFADGSFDCVTIGFGLRNITDKERGAAPRCARAASPAAGCWCSSSRSPSLPGLKPLYDAYSFKVLPWLGRVVAKRRGELPLPRRIDPPHPDQATL